MWSFTGFDYWGQALILFQPFLFIQLFDSDWLWVREGFKYKFYLLSVVFAIQVYKIGFSFRFYTTELILQYVFMTMLATYLYNLRFNIKQSICLAFLTSFLNSYYWELPLHIIDYIQVFPNYFANLNVFIPQLLRLTPLIFFIPRFRYQSDAKQWLFYGILVSTIIVILNYTVYPPHNPHYPERAILYGINRLVCLVILVKTIIEADHVEKITCAPL